MSNFRGSHIRCEAAHGAIHNGPAPALEVCHITGVGGVSMCFTISEMPSRPFQESRCNW